MIAVLARFRGAAQDAVMADGETKTAARGARFGHGFLRDIWYFAALESELRPGRPIRRVMLGEPVLLARSPGGQLLALRDICPHRAAPLSAGRFTREADGAESLECAYHGWRFATDGRCRAIPSLTADDTLEPGRIVVRRYPAVESQGLILVWMGSETRTEIDIPAPPRFPGVVGGRPKLTDEMTFDAHIDHAVVGLMDPAHGPFVHRQWWWRSRRSMHAKAKRFEPAPEGFVMVRHAPSRNSRAYALLGGAPRTEISFRLPGWRYEHIEAGRRQVLSLTCLTPETETRTRITQVLWTDHPVFALAGPLVRAGARRFLRQDGAMVDLQNQGLKYDPPLMWIDDADRQAKWYQALKREWIASRAEQRAFVNPVEPATLRWTS
jgi:phenylpropionate dioxygenase-like ring-hydroxylating dioxygenase large terminal subunit